MRYLAALGVLVGMVIGLHGAARAEPPEPTACDCHGVPPLSFDRINHDLELAYAAELAGATSSASEAVLDASVSLGLTYRVVFGRRGRAAYRVLVAASAAAHRLAGSVDATGTTTHAELALGAARFSEVDADHRHNNLVPFPFSFELVHDGELAAMPRLAARPDVRRDPYAWQRLELTTRAVRAEFDSDAFASGSIVGDFLSLRAAVDLTAQDDRRIATTVTGAMVSFIVDDPAESGTVDFAMVEQQWLELPDGERTDISTMWAMRVETSAPRDRGRLGASFGMAYFPDATQRAFDPDGKGIIVGGIGWWHGRGWGGIGWQYKRVPYITMAAQAALEDRLSLEANRTGAIDLRGQAFVARTRRLVDGGLQSDLSGGVALDAHRRLGGVDVTLSGEIGRSFYGALDGAAPTPGLATRATLTIRAAGESAWSW